MKVSVIIPTINDPYLVRTINETWSASEQEIEYVIINDGGNILDLKTLSPQINKTDIKIIHNTVQMGRRVSINNAVKMAFGEYIFILDAHCNMSKGWDTKLMESAGDKNISYAVIRDIHPDTWEYRPGWYGHVRVNRDYTEKWWPRKQPESCETEEESIAFTGCAWMIKKDRFLALGGYDESLGMYGWDGPEWALKTWFSGGRVILRTDVICGHIFGTNDGSKLYPCKIIPRPEYVKYMKDRYETRMPELIERFSPVPEWDDILIKKKGADVGPQVKREIKVERKDEHVTRDSKGNIIKKVIEYFEYNYFDNGDGPSEDEIAAEYGPKAKKVREEVWELRDGTLQNVA